MNILILGGIAESKELAERLIAMQHQIIYSIVGLVRQPQLNCEIHIGGFGSSEQDGIRGLMDFCLNREIHLIVDASHPYAVEISKHAVQAANQANIPCWRFERPGWKKSEFENWTDFNNIKELITKIYPYSRPFFSIGKSAMQYYDSKPARQEWFIRSARPFENRPGITQINAIGPFKLEDELQLLKKYRIDCLISKNSGCQRVAAKMDAARQLGIPAFVQVRPALPAANQVFGAIEPLVDAIV